ncbi:MAG: D-alanyl-D-alanine carboxypeptidase [Candidatus Electronema aureum]|uniref:D-alanyl-D-alanine carboxypeptidase n=1 Tax=Candidatus Electronema aureum TaxID=2005002 RepID=A0A521G2S6_9BACT|nr:MAG: D-alanyl-D-alanine carboxypeptidase [Candidatus Electronema aureum]
MCSNIVPLFLTLLLAVGQNALAADCPPPYAGLIQNGAYAVADLQGNIVESCNIDTPYIPASILKVPTALAALAILGPEYRFKTRFYTDAEDGLYIQGFGDPMLTSEEIRLIFAELKQRGLRQVNAIYIDPSNFALEYQSPGSEFSDNPYDAPVGPTAVNFNSVPVRVTREGFVSSGEEHTPLLPLMTELAAGLPPSTWTRINICRGRCNANREMARYTAQLFRALQQEAGIPGQGHLSLKQVPPDVKLFYEHRSSKNLQELTSSFLKYSSNFISNLVYLAVGAEEFGWPATWSKADRAVHQELERQLGQQTAAALIHKDGSGLYRGDRVTARAMLEVLRAFRPHAWLLRKHLGTPSKSGSMKGVWNYAGYLVDGKAYVILLNQAANRRNDVLALLQNGGVENVVRKSVKRVMVKKKSKKRR